MEKVAIHTTQNVSIEYSLANVGERILANIIDYLIFAGYYLIIYVVAYQISSNFPTAVHVIISLPVLLYQLIMEAAFNGQSLGMMQRKIKVICLDGKQPNIGHYLLRWLLRPVDITLTTGVAGILSIVLTKNGQRLGDLAAGTTVVKMKDNINLSDTIFEETDENYQPIFMQVSRLNEKDVEIIKDVIKHYETSGNAKPAIILGKKLKKMLDLQTDMATLELLKTLIKDFNHITGRV